MLSAELLVKGGRHDLSSDVSRGIEVSLALGATRRGDHLEGFTCGREVVVVGDGKSNDDLDKDDDVNGLSLSLSLSSPALPTGAFAHCLVTAH